MNINFGIYCLGYSVGGRDYPFEIEINEKELKGMSSEEKEAFIYKVCWEYVTESLEICINDEDEDEE